MVSKYPGSGLQVNLEFLVVDKRTFLTDKERALQMLFGEANDIQETFNSEIVAISDRIATAFASLKVRNMPVGYLPRAWRVNCCPQTHNH
jgi:hypothetical protein